MAQQVQDPPTRTGQCAACGLTFESPRRGRPRIYCYECAPSGKDRISSTTRLATFRATHPEKREEYNRQRREETREFRRTGQKPKRSEETEHTWPRRGAPMPQQSMLPAAPPESYDLANFEKFCGSLKLDTGGPFELEEFQREMLVEYFEGITETVIIIPKKNGKTTLLAALALYHLKSVADAECVIAASSRDQARILFKQATGLVRRSGMADVFDMKPGYGEIRLWSDPDGARIRVLPADVATADGVIPTLALVDELHRHPSAELYGVFRDGLGPRQGRMITISTAGTSEESPLGLLRKAAHALPSFRRDHEAKRNYAKAEDLVLHEWCLDPRDDVHDMELVKRANPAKWQTVDALRKRHDSPSMALWQWVRFACGIWTEGEDPWLDPAIWDGLTDEALEPIGPDEEIVVGVDLGLKQQDTGITLVARRDGLYVPEAVILHPPVSLGDVEDEMRRIKDEYNVLTVAYDPTNFEHSAVALEDEGLVMSRVPQSAERMAAASATLLSVIQAGELVHNGDGALRAHVLAGATKQYERGWRLVKDPRTRRSIGALIAMAMAIEEWQGVASEPLIASM